MIIEGPNHLLKSALPISEPLPRAIQSQFGSSSISESSGSCIFAPFRAIWNFFIWIKSLICCERPTEPVYELPEFTVEEFAELIGIPPEILRPESNRSFRICETKQLSLQMNDQYEYVVVVHGFIRKKEDLLQEELAPLNVRFENCGYLAGDQEITDFGYERTSKGGLEKSGTVHVTTQQGMIDYLSEQTQLFKGATVERGNPIQVDMGGEMGVVEAPAWTMALPVSMQPILEVVAFGDDDFAIKAHNLCSGGSLQGLPTSVNLILQGVTNEVEKSSMEFYGFKQEGNDLVRLKNSEGAIRVAPQEKHITASSGHFEEVFFEQLPPRGKLVLLDVADKVESQLAEKYGFTKRGNDLIRKH